MSVAIVTVVTDCRTERAGITVMFVFEENEEKD